MKSKILDFANRFKNPPTISAKTLSQTTSDSEESESYSRTSSSDDISYSPYSAAKIKKKLEKLRPSGIRQKLAKEPKLKLDRQKLQSDIGTLNNIREIGHDIPARLLHSAIQLGSHDLVIQLVKILENKFSANDVKLVLGTALEDGILPVHRALNLITSSLDETINLKGTELADIAVYLIEKGAPLPRLGLDNVTVDRVREFYKTWYSLTEGTSDPNPLRQEAIATTLGNAEVPILKLGSGIQTLENTNEIDLNIPVRLLHYAIELGDYSTVVQLVEILEREFSHEAVQRVLGKTLEDGQLPLHRTLSAIAANLEKRGNHDSDELVKIAVYLIEKRAPFPYTGLANITDSAVRNFHNIWYDLTKNTSSPNSSLHESIATVLEQATTVMLGHAAEIRENMVKNRDVLRCLPLPDKKRFTPVEIITSRMLRYAQVDNTNMLEKMSEALNNSIRVIETLPEDSPYKEFFDLFIAAVAVTLLENDKYVYIAPGASIAPLFGNPLFNKVVVGLMHNNIVLLSLNIKEFFSQHPDKRIDRLHATAECMAHEFTHLLLNGNIPSTHKIKPYPCSSKEMNPDGSYKLDRNGRIILKVRENPDKQKFLSVIEEVKKNMLELPPNLKEYLEANKVLGISEDPGVYSKKSIIPECAAYSVEMMLNCALKLGSEDPKDREKAGELTAAMKPMFDYFNSDIKGRLVTLLNESRHIIHKSVDGRYFIKASAVQEAIKPKTVAQAPEKSWVADFPPIPRTNSWLNLIQASTKQSVGVTGPT